MTRSVQEPGVGSVIETAGPARAQWNEYRLRCVAEGIEPQATCWYVQGWLREHPEALAG